MAKITPPFTIQIPLLTKETGSYSFTIAARDWDDRAITFSNKYKFGWFYYTMTCPLFSSRNPTVYTYLKEWGIDDKNRIWEVRIVFVNYAYSDVTVSGNWVWIGVKA